MFSLIVIQATPAENVWHPRSKSARSQVSGSSLLLTDRDVRASMDLYGRHAGFSPATKRSAIYYLSQNIGPAVAGSAGLAPPPLLSSASMGNITVNFAGKHR